MTQRGQFRMAFDTSASSQDRSGPRPESERQLRQVRLDSGAFNKSRSAMCPDTFYLSVYL
jgi:hypothetical protein